MGAGLSGVGFLLTQQHPLDPTLQLINFDIALVLAPFLLLGVGLGTSPLVLLPRPPSYEAPSVLCQVMVRVPAWHTPSSSLASLASSKHWECTGTVCCCTQRMTP